MTLLVQLSRSLLGGVTRFMVEYFEIYSKPLYRGGQLKFDRDVVRRDYCIVLASQRHYIAIPVVTMPTRSRLAINGGIFGVSFQTTGGRRRAKIRRRWSNTDVLH